jgi:hypothetical protein
VDVVGVFSTINYIYVSIAVELALCYLLSVWMKRVHAKHGWILRAPGDDGSEGHAADIQVFKLESAAAYLLAFDFCSSPRWSSRPRVRQANEPYVQLPYIQGTSMPRSKATASRR